MSGLFISFEGSEGAGKSTQLERLARHLEAIGRRVVRTREPGGTALGEAVRGLLQHDEAGADMTPEAELLLFAASRAQLCREVVGPALEAGNIVLSDRFLDSTTVYQGVARGLDRAAVETINGFAAGERVPHLTVLIDVDPVDGMRRARDRSLDAPDRIEREEAAFFETVRDGYRELAETHPERFFTVDGTRPADALEADIRHEVERRFA